MAITWRDSADALVVGPTVVTASPGSAGTPVIRRLYNNFGGVGAADLPPKRLKALVRDPGQTYYVASGSEWTDQHYLKARISQGLGGLTLDASEFKPLGAGAYLELPRLANGEGVEIELEIDAPIDTASDTVQALLRLSSLGGVVIADGLTEATPDGIYMPLRNAGLSLMVSSDGPVVENPGGADGRVSIPTVVFIGAGVPRTRRTELTDVIPAAASGKNRYDLLSLAADGTVTRTAGSEITGALTPTNEPEMPQDEIPIARVYMDDTGIIQNADLVDRRQFALFAARASALNLTVAMGPYARVDNWFDWSPEEQTITLPASTADIRIWLKRSGAIDFSLTATPPESRALLLWIATTDGSTVTELVDCRFFVGYRSHHILFRYDGDVVDADQRYAYLDSDREALIVPTAGVFLGAANVGDGTADQLRFDVEVEQEPEDWQSLFEDTANRPLLAFDADPLVGRFKPDTFIIPRRARMRSTVDGLPSGGSTPPQHAVLSVEVAL